MKNIKIPLTEDEIKAIQAYSGYKHAKINIIADLQPEKIDNLSKKGWDLEISREELKKLIEEFINIYSVIYKQGEYELSTTLYRGTTKDEVKNYKMQLTSRLLLRCGLQTCIWRCLFTLKKKVSVVLLVG